MGLTDVLNRTADRLESYIERETERQREAPKPLQKVKLPKRYSRRDPHPLEDEEVDSFLIASGEYYREHRNKLEKAHPSTSTPRDRADFITWLGHRHPNRIRRIGRDFDWLREQARVFGMSPEEVRWLL